jgi:hypothetical protein
MTTLITQAIRRETGVQRNTLTPFSSKTDVVIRTRKPVTLKTGTKATTAIEEN